MAFDSLWGIPKLTPDELFFQSIYKKYPFYHIELPHEPHYFQDIFRELGATMEPDIYYRQEEYLYFEPDLDVTWLRHERFLPAVWHSNTFINVLFLLRGECTVFFSDGEIRLSKGNVLIIAPEVLYAVSAFDQEAVPININLRKSTFDKTFLSLLSGETILNDFFNSIILGSSPYSYIYFNTAYDELLFKEIRRFNEEYNHSHKYRNALLINILECFFILLIGRHEKDVLLPARLEHLENQNLISILRYMQDNFASLTLEKLASVFGYSPRQMQRIIKVNTGLSYSENIQKLKMVRSAALLKESTIDITAIASEVGFHDAGNFRRIFKKYYHMTPGEYRSGCTR